MTHFDVFNGDADGICALLQLRLADPVDAIPITGIKRDITLLTKVAVQVGDKVTVLDISLDKNRDPLCRILEHGAQVFYVDHHAAGVIPDHPALTALIDTDADICTSLLVDRYLQGRYRNWAIVGAFGDNLENQARQLATEMSLPPHQLEQLKQLGIGINYNSYGDSLTDLHFAPEILYRYMMPFASPFAFIADNPTIYRQLFAGYMDDLNQAQRIAPEYCSEAVAVFILPDQPWARRISGVWANDLAYQHPHRGHAIIRHNNAGGYLVSVRAPLHNKTGADTLCALFPSGGGRKAAAGINHLPETLLSAFITQFNNQYDSKKQ